MTRRPPSAGILLLGFLLNVFVAIVIAFAAVELNGALSVLLWITFGIHVFGTVSVVTRDAA